MRIKRRSERTRIPRTLERFRAEDLTGNRYLTSIDVPAAGSAPADIDYLVGTADADLSAEIVVGTSPGGELGNTWASPTVDASHSGSTHAAAQAAAEATASSALTTHAALTAHAGGHGASDHTDITRTIWLPARPYMGADSGTSLTAGTTPDFIPTYRLDNDATQGIFCDFAMPADAKATTAITCSLYWASISTDASAHTVRWSVDAYALVAGASVGTAGTTTVWTGDSAARTALFLVIESAQQILASTSANDIIRLDIRRLGSDGADTLASNLNIIGALISYTATQ